MQKKIFKPIQFVLFFLSLLGLVGWVPINLFGYKNHFPFGSPAWLNTEVQLISVQAPGFNPAVIRLGLLAYLKARRNGLDEKQIITLIDYSKPSTTRRLLVVNLRRHKVLFHTYVCHGKNSGKMNAISFSNRPGSLKSSIGVFLTERSYVGCNGYSLRLIGLEPGVNDNAYRRAIVIHGAWYAHPDIIKRYGQLGRSWGCPTVSDRLARPLIDTIKERTLVFVYSNHDRKWLHHSPFLAAA